MAAGQRSFIYRLIMNLESEGAFGEMASQVTRLGDVTEQTRSTVGNMMEQLQKQVPETDDRFEQLRRSIANLDENASVDKLQGQLQEIRGQLIRNSNAVEESGQNFNDMVRRVARAESAVENLTKAQMAANAQADQLGAGVSGVGTAASNVTPKTNMMSQSILQGMQDAQFGVIGVANNIQMAGQQLAQAKQRGFTFGQVMKSTMRSLIMGPMAIGTVITLVTLLAQNWDDVTAAVESFQGTVNEAQRDTQEFIKQTEKGLKELETSFKGQELISTLDDLSGEDRQTAFKIFRDRALDVGAALQKWDNRAQELGASTESLSNKLAGMATESGHFAQEMISLTAGQISKLEKETGMTVQKVAQLARREDELAKVLTATNAQSLRELSLRQRLKRVYGLQGEQLEKLTKIILEDKKETEEQNEALRDNIRLRELQIRAMEEGLDKQFAEIGLEMDKLQKNLNDKFGDSPLLDQMLGLVPDIGQKERQKAISGFMDDLVSEMKAGKEELGIEEETNRIFIPGFGVVDPEKELKRQREFFKTTEKTLKQNAKNIRRQRKQGGPQAESLLGAGIFQRDVVEQDRFEFQQRLLEKEEEARLERLKNARQFQLDKAQLLGPNSSEGQKALNRAETLQEQITRTEQEYQRRREKNQKKHLRNKIRAFDKAGKRLTSDASIVASSIFETWKRNRQKELENQGKTQEQQRKILKEEGKKRFQVMKSLKIANAVASGISSAVNAWEAGTKVAASMGGFGYPAIPVAYTALSIAKTATQIRKLSSLSIGDKLPSGGGSGGGLPSGSFTQGSPSRNARRAADFGSQMQRRRTRRGKDSINKAADKINKAADKIENQEVTYDDPTAEDIQNRGERRSRTLNI